MKLIDEIITYLKTVTSASEWEIANYIYDGCMNMPQKGNGARISNIVRALWKSDEVIAFHSNGYRRWAIKTGRNAKNDSITTMQTIWAEEPG